MLIIKYKDRRLYDTENKKFITIEQIFNLLPTLKELTIIDDCFGDDITCKTLLNCFKYVKADKQKLLTVLLSLMEK